MKYLSQLDSSARAGLCWAGPPTPFVLSPLVQVFESSEPFSRCCPLRRRRHGAPAHRAGSGGRMTSPLQAEMACHNSPSPPPRVRGAVPCLPGSSRAVRYDTGNPGFPAAPPQGRPDDIECHPCSGASRRATSVVPGVVRCCCLPRPLCPPPAALNLRGQTKDPAHKNRQAGSESSSRSVPASSLDTSSRAPDLPCAPSSDEEVPWPLNPSLLPF